MENSSTTKKEAAKNPLPDHPFTHYTPLWPWLIALIGISLFVLLLYAWTELPALVWQLLLLGPLVSLGQFLSSPLFRQIGLYYYLSPLFLVYGRSQKQYDLHQGTSFDWLLVLYGTPIGLPLRRRLLAYSIAGLLQIIRELEEEKIPPSIQISASSYFFSQQSMQRLGFTVQSAKASAILNLALNYLDLLWMYSLAWGRLRFPRIQNARLVKISGEQLLLQKERLQKLHDYLAPSRL